jgi:hypothetical protein
VLRHILLLKLTVTWLEVTELERLSLDGKGDISVEALRLVGEVGGPSARALVFLSSSGPLSENDGREWVHARLVKAQARATRPKGRARRTRGRVSQGRADR